MLIIQASLKYSKWWEWESNENSYYCKYERRRW